MRWSIFISQNFIGGEALFPEENLDRKGRGRRGAAEPILRRPTVDRRPRAIEAPRSTSTPDWYPIPSPAGLDAPTSALGCAGLPCSAASLCDGASNRAGPNGRVRRCLKTVSKRSVWSFGRAAIRRSRPYWTRPECLDGLRP